MDMMGSNQTSMQQGQPSGGGLTPAQKKSLYQQWEKGFEAWGCEEADYWLEQWKDDQKNNPNASAWKQE